MSRFARSTNHGRAFVAICVFAAFLCALALSASPQLHQRVHKDANRAEHNCAATMIASGSYDHAAHPPLVSAPAPARSIFQNSGVDPVLGSIAVSWRMHFRARAACALLNCRASVRDVPNNSASAAAHALQPSPFNWFHDNRVPPQPITP